MRLSSTGWIIVVAALFASVAPARLAAAPSAERYVLLPQPRHIAYADGHLMLEPGRLIWLDNEKAGDLFTAASVIKRSFAQWGVDWDLTAARGIDRSLTGVEIFIEPNRVRHPQGYRLVIAADGITIVAHDAAGAFHAAQTLRQICRQADPTKGLACLTIDDWPDFPHRGVLLDISRDQVPKMETLYGLVDLLAEWKINQLQLYTEHTFAYRNHAEVWRGKSPMTAGEIMLLDRYCRERFVELVPCQNSFGHMERWFKHEKYRPLAELDFGDPSKTGGRMHFSLAPAVPEAIGFVAGLYDELIPNFSSSQINVCCDETSDLGLGKSAALCAERGKGRVYLDFLLKIHEQVRKHGKTMQFWCDIVVNHPELVPELPKDVIALVWGYSYDDKRLDHAATFDSLGIPFYMCPGTGTWLSLTGRTENLLYNHRKAATLGLKHKALGYLNCNWGDMGNWQPLPVCYPGYAYGAAVGWAVNENLAIDLPAVLDLHAFYDKAGIMGRLVCDLGNTYLKTMPDIEQHEQMKYALFRQLVFPEAPLSSLHVEETFEDTIAYIDRTLAPLANAQMNRPDAGQIIAELKNASAVLRHSCHLGIARLKVADRSIANIPEATRRELAGELSRIIDEHRRLWVVRNRTGGLDDSVERVMNTMRLYRAP